MTRTRDLVLPLVVMLGALPGCGGEDSPTAPPDSEPSVREFWQGTYTGATPGGADHGPLVFDVIRTGTRVTGEMVFYSRDSGAFGDVRVQGAGDGETLHVVPDTSQVHYVFDATLEGTASGAGTFTGTLRYDPTGLVAEVSCGKIPVAGITSELSVDMPDYIRGLADDGEHIWASTLSDFMLLDSQGVIQDRLMVELWPNIYWTSDALTWDGSLLWGHLPGTRNGVSVSTLVAFSPDGTVQKQVETPDRSSGLAAAGADLWSLSNGRLLRVDTADGSVLESVPVDVPDLVDLASDGTDFWAVGWFLPRLYRIDRSGRVLEVADLPDAPGAVYPRALALDGDSFWVSRSRSGPGSWLFRFHLDAPI